MCGWDTDCNAGNVGTIMGVAVGLEGIKKSYLKPINDFIALSGISGYLNIVDVPSYTKKIATLAYQVKGEAVPQELLENFSEKELLFDFELPGSTHNFRVSDPFYCSVYNTDEQSYSGKRSLGVLFDRMVRGKKSKVFVKPYYRREDFSDERYMPVFSPKAYPGQRVSMMVNVDRWNGESMYLSTYVRNTRTKEDIILESRVVVNSGWNSWSFIIPDLGGDMVDEIGLIVEGNSPDKYKDLGVIYIDDFRVDGKANYTIDISRQKKEFASITPFSHNHGAWEIENGYMSCMCLDHAEAMTGNYFMENYKVIGKVVPVHGESHLISARVQGAMRGYYAGFNSDNKVSILKNDFGLSALVTVDFDWELGREYEFTFEVNGDSLKFYVNGDKAAEVSDDSFTYGMTGYAKYSLGRSLFGDLSVEEY